MKYGIKLDHKCPTHTVYVRKKCQWCKAL